MDTQACFSIILLFLANFLTIQAADKEPFPDRIKYFGGTHPNVGKPWSITCDGLTEEDKVEWRQNGIPVKSDFDTKEFLVSTNKTSSTLSTAVAKESQQGEYKCISTSTTSHYLQVNAAPPSTDQTTIAPASVVKLPANSSVVEGGILNLVCSAPASLEPQITWQIGNQNYSSSKDRISITRDAKQGIENSTLTIVNVTMADGGRIYCRVSLKNEAFTQLTVLPRTPSSGASPLGSGSKLQHSTNIICLLYFLIGCILFSI